MNSDLIREVTQSAIALAVVLATFYILVTQPGSSALPIATTALGAILGYYFTRTTQSGTVSAILKAQDANKP